MIPGEPVSTDVTTRVAMCSPATARRIAISVEGAVGPLTSLVCPPGQERSQAIEQLVADRPFGLPKHRIIVDEHRRVLADEAGLRERRESLLAKDRGLATTARWAHSRVPRHRVAQLHAGPTV